jgi:hypothetical protein
MDSSVPSRGMCFAASRNYAPLRVQLLLPRSLGHVQHFKIRAPARLLSSGPVEIYISAA